MATFHHIEYILNDIEGTTTSVDFVYKTLFPFFIANVHETLQKHQNQATIQSLLAEITQVAQNEYQQTLTHLDDITQFFITLTQKDIKQTTLKTLQGFVWKEGYQKGLLKGHLYEDVQPAFMAWKNAGKKIGIYSSGSVEAQKLIFGTSIFGDLTPLISHYFDTHIGAKRESESYRKIAQEIQIAPEKCLFLSDIEAELDAAKNANMQTAQLIREEATPSTKHNYIQNYTQIILL